MYPVFLISNSKYNHTVIARDIENYEWNLVYTETNINIALEYM